MRELQVLINYNNYGARSDGIFVRFFSDINFFSSLFGDAVAFFGDTFFVFFDLRWCCCFFSGVCYFTMESLILAQDER